MIDKKYYEIRVSVSYVFLPTMTEGWYSSGQIGCLYEAQELLRMLTTKYNQYGYRLVSARLVVCSREDIVAGAYVAKEGAQ